MPCLGGLDQPAFGTPRGGSRGQTLQLAKIKRSTGGIGGAERWLDADYKVMRFAPAEISLKPGDGPPHIRLDRAADFLLGDRL